MADLSGRVCDFCGAPIRTVVDGACPFCKTLVPAPMVEAAARVAAAARFDVVLVDVGKKRIDVIKVIRELTGLGLKEAKELTDVPPSTIAGGLDEVTAQQWATQLMSAGARVELRHGAPAVAAAEPTGTSALVIVDVGKKKINVIKVIRELTGLGLKEAKDLAEAAPVTMTSGLDGATAHDWATKLANAGAQVELRPG